MVSEDPYRDPALYDLEYAEQADDVGFYVSLARRERGPVLELGCGNGRITLPIARAGVEVHGEDVSEAMLADLERKLQLEPEAVRWRVRARQGDFRAIDVPMAYPLVILPFNAIHHCAGPEEVRAMLAGVRRALRPGGVFAMDCYLPDPVLYSRDPGKRYEERDYDHPRTGERLHSWEQGWWDPERRVHHVVYVYADAQGREDEVHLELHMFEQAEMREWLHQAGFAITWEAQDFAGTPIAPNALKWVLELRLR